MAKPESKFNWTPELAIELADRIVALGLDSRQNHSLRASARNNGGTEILEKRAEQAMDAARGSVTGDGQEREMLTMFREFLDRALNGGRSTPDAQRNDPLREAVIDRMAQLKITAYRVAQLSEGAVSEDAVRRYQTRMVSLNSRHVSVILSVLGWNGINWLDTVESE